MKVLYPGMVHPCKDYSTGYSPFPPSFPLCGGWNLHQRNAVLVLVWIDHVYLPHCSDIFQLKRLEVLHPLNMSGVAIAMPGKPGIPFDAAVVVVRADNTSCKDLSRLVIKNPICQ